MISLADIQEASRKLGGSILRTPLIRSPTFSKMAEAEVYLKLENLQMGGSFKVRGASYKIQSHLSDLRGKGVIAASVGNHAQGVALAARAAGVAATIVMPVWSSLAKQEATRGYGARVLLQGENLTESIEIAQKMADSSGRTFIHPYDDLEVMAGQGTIGIEILQDLPDPDYILVPVGGGGLIGGIATAVKALRPGTQVIGVQAAACPSARAALKAGRPVLLEATEEGSLADAIMVSRIGEANFPLLRDLVDEIAEVSEDQIASAMLLLLERKRILAEGAAAVPLAALQSGQLQLKKGSKVVLVISGGNVDSLLLDRVIHRGLVNNGRLMGLSLSIEDVPGSLQKLLAIIAARGANVVRIHHSREEKDLPLGQARVELELETRGFEHRDEIIDALKGGGYRMKIK
jgi:threonine dehydratase